MIYYPLKQEVGLAKAIPKLYPRELEAFSTSASIKEKII